jgi:hypothetical protein
MKNQKAKNQKHKSKTQIKNTNQKHKSKTELFDFSLLIFD